MSRGDDCSGIFPSPLAVERLKLRVGRKQLHFAANMKCQREEVLPPHLRDSEALPQQILLGIGGNGIVFEHDVRGCKYAVKWVSAEFSFRESRDLSVAPVDMK